MRFTDDTAITARTQERQVVLDRLVDAGMEINIHKSQLMIEPRRIKSLQIKVVKRELNEMNKICIFKMCISASVDIVVFPYVFDIEFRSFQHIIVCFL